LKEIPDQGKIIEKKVKEMFKNGKNIYKNIKGHENEINYEVYDLSPTMTGLRNLNVNMVVLYPNMVNQENKMTTGSVHVGKEGLYFFISGRGKVIRKKAKEEEFYVKEGDIVTVPSGHWHRVINLGDRKLVYLTIFES
jgi:mannose-6-phosphate isomerase-like protein (cupin superfamily)